MDITITGYDGENVIAQIIEDLLSVNGLSVKREDFSPANANLSIDQLDRQLSLFKKNKVVFNIKVIKEDKPRYAPKAKMSRFKTSLPEMANIIGQVVNARPNRAVAVDDDLGDILFGDAPAPAVAVAPAPAVAVAPAAPVGPRYVAEAPVYVGRYAPRGDVAVVAEAIPAEQAPPGIADVIAAEVGRNAQIRGELADVGNEVARIRNDLAALVNEQEIADEMPVAPNPYRFEYRAPEWAAPRRR